MLVLAVLACNDTAESFNSPGPWFIKDPGSSGICAEPGSMAVPGALAQFSTVPAGTIAGSFSVTSTGEAIYSMPLEVVPGRAAMQPSLGITYDSSADEGVLGLGFGISGLSAISRCPKNLAQDGEIAAVRDEPLDALCLDSLRLVPVDPADSKPVEFRTVPDTFARIVADYASIEGWDAARGPKRFRVFAKGGLILDYGSADSGQVLSKKGVVRAWLLTSQRDRSGNFMSLAYVNDKDPTEGFTVEHAPLRIDYTGHELAPPSRAVVFEYEKREKIDTRTLFARGMALKRSLRLKKIKMLAPGDALVREYRFVYTTAPSTKRTLLDQVEECAADGACKPPTRFTWHHGSGTGFVEIATPILDPESDSASVMLADVTGDGLDDLVVGDVDMTGGSEQPITNFIVAPNKSQELAPAFFDTSAIAHQLLLYDPPVPVFPERGTPLDYNHDGLADLFLHDVYGHFTTWRVLLAQPDHTLVMHDTGLPRPYPPIPGVPLTLASWDSGAHVADISGDGMPDLIQCVYNGVNHSWFLHPWAPEDPGFDKSASTIFELSSYPCNAELHPVDVDIDGRIDLLVHSVTETGNGPIFGTTYDALSFEQASGSWTRVNTNLPIAPLGGRLIFLDVNGDGLPDAVQTGFQDRQPLTLINTGRGFRNAVASLPAAMIEPDAFAKLASVIDWNADGKQDLLMPVPNPGGTPSWKILQSTGSIDDGTFVLVDPGIPFEAQILVESTTLAEPFGPRITDVDGDGIQDVILVLQNQFHIFKNKLFQEDLLATVTDGLAAYDPGDPGFLPNVQITYDHLIDRAITTGSTGIAKTARTYLARDNASDTACDYPIRCVVGPRRVVSKYLLNSGKDKPRSFSIAYRNGRYHRLGRGFLGFGMRIVRDLDTGSGTAELFDNETFDINLNAFPFAGHIAHEWRWSPTFIHHGDVLEVALELLFTHIPRQTIPTAGGQTYFTLPILERKRREQSALCPLDPLLIEEQVRLLVNGGAEVLSDATRWILDFDLFGNITQELITTKDADSEILIEREFDVDETSWLVGQLKKQTECSSAAGMKQCRATEREYDDNGLLKFEKAGATSGDPETKLSVKLVRDDFGNVRLLTREDGFGKARVECTTYDAEGIFPYAHTNAAGHTSHFRFNKHFGELSVLVDPNGLITKWGFDGFGRLTKEIRPDGTATTYELTRTKDGGPQKNAWNLKLRTVTLGFQDDTVELDPLGRPVRWWTQGFQVGAQPPERIMQEVVFDSLGEKVERRSVPAGELTPPQKLAYNWVFYDAMGRVTKRVTPWNAVTNYRYYGRRVEVHGPSGALTVIENDPLGRPVAIKDPENGITAYSYGPFGMLWKVTDPDGAVTETERDEYGRVRKHKNPVRGTTEAHYNGFDEQTSALDAENRHFQFWYDALGRLLHRQDADGLTTWTYDTAAHGIGKLAKVESPAGDAILYSYDLFGRPSTTAKNINGQVYESKIDYDNKGRAYKLTYPQPAGLGAFVVQYNFDAYGHVIAVRDALTQNLYWKLLAADGAGRLTEEEFGAQAAKTTRSYFEAKERVKSIVTVAGGKTVQDLSYFYDKRLNLLSRTDGRQGKSELFTYDLLDRLTSAEFSPGFGRPTQYEYSPGGDLVEKSDVGVFTYHSFRPHILTSVDGDLIGHDAVGNLTSRPGETIGYNAFDLPSAITKDGFGMAAFSYDGFQQRVRKVTPLAETVYFGDLYERITPMDPAQPVEHRYSVYNGERLIASVTRKNGAPDETRFVHSDHLGSIDVLTDELGVPKERRSYDAFGGRRSEVWASGQSPTPAKGTAKGFTEHEGDEDLGLVNMKGRLMDPRLGRFLTPDQIVSKPSFGQSWNPFAYVRNNPLKYVDPSGFQEQPASDPAAITRDDSKDIHVWVFGEPRKPPPEPPGRNGPREAANAGAKTTPTDLGVTGNSAGSAPSPSPTSTELPEKPLSPAAGVLLGAARGVGIFALETGKTLALTALTFGGYATFKLYAGMWAGYNEQAADGTNMGVVGAINSLNPLYAIAKGGLETYGAAQKGDFEAAGEKGVVTAILSAVTVVGVVQGLSALGGKLPSGAVSGTGARGLPRACPSVERAKHPHAECAYQSGNDESKREDSDGIGTPCDTKNWTPSADQRR
ncbi:MAG: type IV secretion protein Rhs [Polyangiaceae bacterium]|nr:type IV secretion protein Rhs [Polyangiaceae bacterium]